MKITKDRRCRVCDGKGAFKIATGWMLQKCNWCGCTGASVISASPVVRSSEMGRPLAETAERRKCRLCGNDIAATREVCDPCVWQIATDEQRKAEEGKRPTGKLTGGTGSAQPETPKP
jgi:hypothetical protein